MGLSMNDAFSPYTYKAYQYAGKLCEIFSEKTEKNVILK